MTQLSEAWLAHSEFEVSLERAPAGVNSEPAFGGEGKEQLNPGSPLLTQQSQANYKRFNEDSGGSAKFAT